MLFSTEYMFSPNLANCEHNAPGPITRFKLPFYKQYKTLLPWMLFSTKYVFPKPS